MRVWLRTTSLVSKEPLQQMSNIICESRKSIPTKSGRECVNKRTRNFQECVTVFKMCEDFKLWKLKFVQKSPKKMCKSDTNCIVSSDTVHKDAKFGDVCLGPDYGPVDTYAWSYKNQYHEIDVPKKRDIVLHLEVQVTESFEELLANPWVLTTFIDCLLDQPRVEVVPWAKRSGRLLCHVSLDVECDVRVMSPLSSSIWHTLTYKSVVLTQPSPYLNRLSKCVWTRRQSTWQICRDRWECVSGTDVRSGVVHVHSVDTWYGVVQHHYGVVVNSFVLLVAGLVLHFPHLVHKFGLVWRHNTTFFLSKERMDSQ